MRLKALFLVASLVLVGASSSLSQTKPELTVFAAADLAFALKDIVANFEQAHDAKVTLVMGSTGQLAQQIAHGAPADVFFAANESFIDDLIRRGAIISETRALYAQGRIALATRKDRGPRLTDLNDLTDPRIRRIAIANPQHAPYGKAAEEALRTVGLWDTLQPRLVYGENIRHTLQFLETGGVDGGDHRALDRERARDQLRAHRRRPAQAAQPGRRRREAQPAPGAEPRPHPVRQRARGAGDHEEVRLPAAGGVLVAWTGSPCGYPCRCRFSRRR